MSEYVLRLLLRVFPPSLRDRWGGDMLAMYFAQLAEVRSRGGSRAWLFITTCGDLLAQGALARLQGMGLARSAPHFAPSRGSNQREGWLRGFRQDAGYALRQLSRRPAFGLAAVTVMALGIGANAAVFSVVNQALLTPLPFTDSNQLVRVSSIIEGHGPGRVSLPSVHDWLAEPGPFEGLGAYHVTEHTLAREAAPIRVNVGRAVGDLFGTVGMSAELGRLFQTAAPGEASAEVVLTNQFWQRQFGADRAVVGQTVILDGLPTRVVGVLPPEEVPLRLGLEIDAWAAMEAPLPWMGRGTGFLTVLGRIGPEWTVNSVQAPLDAMAAAFIATGLTDDGIGVEALHEVLVGESRSLLWALQGAVLLLALIVSLNVANLMAARSLERRGEFAVRVALGAGMGRILRQSLTESALLALLGGGVGLILARLGREIVLRVLPDLAPLMSGGGFGWPVLGFTFLATSVVALVAGVVPTIRSSNRSWASMKDDSYRGPTRVQKGREVLVTIQVGIAFVLVVGSGLMLRTLSNLADQDLGFQPENVLTARLTLPEASHPSWEERHLFFDRMLAEFSALPGVTSVGVTSALPLSRAADGGLFAIEGRDWDRDPGPSISKNSASPGYFRALEIPLLEGRTFNGADDVAGLRVTVISESLAERYFPGESPIGRRIQIDWWGSTMLEIVGVVGDVKQRGPDQADEAAAYIPLKQTGTPSATFVLRTRENPYLMATPMREAVQSLDAGQPIHSVTSMSDLLDRSVANRAAIAGLLIGLSVIGIVISCLGVYSVTAQTVRGRTREFGVRLALGATGETVLGRVVMTEGRTFLTGLALGAAGAATGARALGALLFGVTPIDPLTYLVSAVLLALVVLVAIAGPAWRASRTSPAASLSER